MNRAIFTMYAVKNKDTGDYLSEYGAFLPSLLKAWKSASKSAAKGQATNRVRQHNTYVRNTPSATNTASLNLKVVAIEVNMRVIIEASDE